MTSMGTKASGTDERGRARPMDAGPAAVSFGSGWEYAPAPESVSVEIAARYGHFIGGAFVEPLEAESESGASRHRLESCATSGHFVTINPATEEPLSEIAQGSARDVDRAVAAAREALPGWAGLPGKERGKYLFRIARRIQERARELAVLETKDGGKPIRESRDVDVPLAAAHFFYHAGWADKLGYAFAGWLGSSGSRGDTARTDTARRVVPPPIGVCGQIIPWNFPLLMAAWKLAPALACGNTCVLKPAETTPLTALRLAEILQDVGLPPGVVNIVTGDGRTGQALVEHPGVDKIAFTGSTEVGKRIAQAVAQGSGRGAAVEGGAGDPRHSLESCATSDSLGRCASKRLTLELGGKSPNIIFEDASVDQAVEGIVQGIYFNQGHVCCAGSRLFVQEPVLDEVTRKLEIRLASLRVGDPLDKNTDVGAINSRAQLETIERYVAEGARDGATLHEVNGSALPGAGYWRRPCFFTGVQPASVIAREEIFGPVLAVMSFRTPEEAITRANNTPYGLAAGVWTDKGSKIFEIARRLKAGVVWLNTYNRFDPTSPFGGYKESGFGREGGIHGLRAYLDLS